MVGVVISLAMLGIFLYLILHPILNPSLIAVVVGGNPEVISFAH